MTLLSIDVEASDKLDYAMVHNAVPLVRRVAVSNPTADVVRDVEVSIELQPGMQQAWAGHISELPAGGTFRFDDIELALDRDRLINTTERERAELVVEARANGTVHGRHTNDVDLLSYNEWSAASVPQLLAAFVMPNHPVVGETLKLARTILQDRTGDPSLNGYQSGSAQRVLAQTAAVYAALQRLDITYANPPASFETRGQKVRTPEQVLGQRMGTCLDLTLFVAACLEQIGLRPLLFVVDGHAFPGVWLVESGIPEAVSDDGIRFRKLAHLDNLYVFDSSAVAKRPAIPLEDANSVAHRYLDDADTFRFGVDVAAARSQKYRPLPARLDTRAFALAAEGEGQPGTAEGREARSAILTRAKVASASTDAPARKPEAPLIPRLELWKRRLLDLTLRNRLINFRENKQTVQLRCADVARLEDMLADGGDFAVLPRPSFLSESDPRSRAQLDAQAGEDAERAYFAEVMERKELHSDLPGDEHERRLVKIWRTARDSLQETGSNTLCIAIGMLAWYENDASDIQRLAPLILVPASLHRKSVGDAFQLCSSDDETRINTTLLERLQNDLGVTIPELAELPLDDSGVDVRRILGLVRAAVANLHRWDVVERVYLGNFSFTKFLMWADIQQKADSLLETELVRHLATSAKQAFPDQGPLPTPEAVDRDYGPKELLCPLDSDSSQQAAIIAAAKGKTFVLQGPPGTGKSQTITNLIAQLLAEGKRVLFVSEKMAALEVVHRRLSSIGLGTYCLELHSHKASKRQVIEQLGDALHTRPVPPPPEWAIESRKLQGERDRLNAYANALHATRGIGISLYRGLSQLIGARNAPRVSLPLEGVDSPETVDDLRETVNALQRSAITAAPIGSNPWRHTNPPSWDLASSERIGRLVDVLGGAQQSVRQDMASLASDLGLAAAPRSIPAAKALCELGELLAHPRDASDYLVESHDWPAASRGALELIELGKDLESRRAQLDELYSDRLFALDLPQLRDRFLRWSGAFFLIAWWMLRSARKLVRPTLRSGALPPNQQLAAHIQSAMKVQEEETRLAESEESGARIFGDTWDRPTRSWDDMRATVEWTGAVRRAAKRLATASAEVADISVPALVARARTAAGRIGASAKRLNDAIDGLERARREATAALGLDEDAQYGPVDDDRYLARVDDAVTSWRPRISELRDWYQYCQHRIAAGKRGLTPLTRMLDAGELEPSDVARTFDRALFHSWTARTISEDPVLKSFFGEEHNRHIDRFVELDNALRDLTRGVVAARVSARIPQPNARTADNSELGTLMRELKKQRRHLPIRRLFREIPNLLERLKPCMLMSPLSVAQYLDPEGDNFDVVVFDEASQIPTYDAIGALARADKAVVVGDSRQLPPTSFFQQVDNADAEPDEDEFDELESILDECVAARVPEMTLNWHYRSRHESLIAFSNYHYYKNRLNTFPSAADRAPDLGVSLRLVEGHYDRGNARDNVNEARAVVAEVVRRLRDPEESKRTIGVVTFSKAQQNRVENLLDEAKLSHPEIEVFFDAGSREEPVIVKNLENIQGDERDVMLFSICYGPDHNGRVAMNFGPLNRDGGERRLNVAITRARQQLIVFSTLQANQIDLSKTRAEGVKHLKTFLDYAQRGPVAIAEATTLSADADFDSPFEKEVHDMLEARGWSLEIQVGCAGYRIDMAVRDPQNPGRFVLGIECDGAAYHSAKSARDRDRLRAQVLGTLGWTLHRIWSTDWWENPEREVEKAEAAIRRALEGAPAASSPTAPAATPEPAHYEPAAVSTNSAAAEPRAAYASRPTPEPPASAPEMLYRVAKLDTAPEAPDACYQATHAAKLLAQILEIVDAEGPITTRLLARRIAPYWSLKRATGRLERRLVELLRTNRAPGPKVTGDVVWKVGQSPETWADVRPPNPAAPDTQRQAADIPNVEIANACLAVLRANLAMDRDDLARETARVFGIGRMGAKVAAHMNEGIDLLVKRGTAHVDGERITLR